MRTGSFLFKNSKPSAFTLVELIVVITILAILATVGFLALQGYTKDAKDSAVKTNLRTVANAVSLESSKDGSSPRKYVLHLAGYALSGATYKGAPLVPGPYGTPGTNYSAGYPNYPALKLDGTNFKDAEDKEFVIGATDLSENLQTGRKRQLNFFQIGGFDAASGAILEGTFPVGETTSSGGLLASSSGSNVALVVGGSSGGGSTPAAPVSNRYPGCDTDDIPLANGQKWAACNVGASTAYVGQPFVFNDYSSPLADIGDFLIPSSYAMGGPPSPTLTPAYRTFIGSYFQWGRNDDITDSYVAGNVYDPDVSNPKPSATPVGHAQFINASDDNRWLDHPDLSLWGWQASTETGGTFASLGNPAAMKGPCQAGYHVPTIKEWCDAAISIDPTNVTNCTLWNTNTTDAVNVTLKLPAPWEILNDGTMSLWGDLKGFYWSSTPYDGGEAYLFNTSRSIPLAFQDGDAAVAAGPIGNGGSIRCLKN